MLILNFADRFFASLWFQRSICSSHIVGPNKITSRGILSRKIIICFYTVYLVYLLLCFLQHFFVCSVHVSIFTFASAHLTLRIKLDICLFVCFFFLAHLIKYIYSFCILFCIVFFLFILQITLYSYCIRSYHVSFISFFFFFLFFFKKKKSLNDERTIYSPVFPSLFHVVFGCRTINLTFSFLDFMSCSWNIFGLFSDYN